MNLNRKNKLLLAGIALMLYACYAFAFSNTLKYYQQFSQQEKLAEQNSADPQLLDQFVNKDKQIDKALELYGNKIGSTFQNELLKQLSALCAKNGLKIIDFKEPFIYTEKNTQTSSYIFSLQGSFNGMLLALNSIENKAQLGFIKHISFTKKRNYKTNTDYLTAEVILQKNESIQ
jgi:hypothetical protein